MKRALAAGIGACLLLIFGCRDYDVRLDETLEEMKYQKRLNQRVTSAGTDLHSSAQRLYWPAEGLQPGHYRARQIRP
jgi:hypothetical protein